ncbi:DMT family transporter [Paeniglutamicibacter sulfureus]|uniref:Drug/metabolite transporter (DMT)-like permease n=1 Tax=Paeniglutamicibacter sulfureus TaxID=43666 RepID=A0ABU2BHE1_9MICC|nr:DMT family transporter [Paeniglutamicibacter sulfureus]MDR7357374.1 drug/metabolite transporter (DMT)-like permease [Paeniglutamicibacter sulfureus]
MVWLAVTAAIAGAFFLAFGTQRQSSVVRASAGGLDVTGWGMLRLFRTPRWVLGLVLLAMGMSLNVYALASAPLTVVQPIGAIALVITTVVNAREHHIKMNRPTILAIIACMVGSAAFVFLAIEVSAEEHKITSGQELLTILILAIAVAVFGGAVVVFPHRLGAFFYILGAGVLFGFVAVLVRTISVSLLDPNGRFLANVSWYSILAVVVAGLLGSYFVQNAYSKGPPDLVIAGLTVIDPIVGISIGIAILGELDPNVQPAIALSMVGAGCIAIVGVIALSRHHPDVLERKAEARRRTKVTDGK